MFNMLIGATKGLLLVFWVAWILSLVTVIPEPYARIVQWVGVVLLLAHLGEYFVVKSRVAARQGGDTGFVGTMLYGFAYWLPVIRGESRDTGGDSSS